MSDKSCRVNRGGSWYFDPQYARVAIRLSSASGFRDGDLGFRLVEEAEDPKPTPAASGSLRVLRGGSWINPARFARVAARSFIPPGFRSSNLGFRLVEVVPAPSRSRKKF
jgi:formylglycine-generating enzyme required for sulfatase activity